MTSITATALRQNIYQTIAQVNENCTPIAITNSKGKGAVLVGESDWAAIEETLFLNGIPGMSESLRAGKEEKPEWFTKQAAKDARKLKAAGLDKKAKALVEVLKRDPFQEAPAYEALVGNLSGLYSRRINLQHRLVYQVYAEPFDEEGVHYQGIVKVVRMWTHYEGL